MLELILNDSFNLASVIIYLISSLVVVFLTLPIHEWAHGFAATKLGDPTPRYQGRLTLNPFAHIDYIGALCICLFGIGWAKPVQVNPRNFRNPKTGMAITAFAGPAMNIIMATVALLFVNLIVLIGGLTVADGTIYYTEMIWVYLYWFFSYIAEINVFLAVFNMIPVPPFDGSRILFSVLPDKYYWRVMQNERILMFAMLLIIATDVLDRPLQMASNGVLELIGTVASLPFRLF